MDFGDAYYQRLMSLLQCNESSAVEDLWKVVDEVAAFYRREGVTEYWASPGEEEVNASQGTTSKQEKPSFPPKKERIEEAASAGSQHLLGPESQERNVTSVVGEANNPAEYSNRKRPSQLTVAGLRGKKPFRDDLLPSPGRIGQEGIACVVCRKLGFSNGNSVVECQECHDIYHQKCHTPNISQNQVDPRCVWYCAKCSKLMRKIAAKAEAAGPLVSPPEKLNTGKNQPSRKPSTADHPLGKMFSRFEASGAFGYSTTTTTSTPKPLRTISDLAANFFAKYQAKSKSQAKLCASSMRATVANDKPSNTSSAPAGNSTSSVEKTPSKPFLTSGNNSTKPSSSSVALASSQLQAAEKRLLQMKKKAALKTTYNKTLP